MQPGEDPAAAAWRDTEEELGILLTGQPHPLGKVKQAGGKWEVAFALEEDVDAHAILRNALEMEWPPRSGRLICLPEVDPVRWYAVEQAIIAILSSERPLIYRLAEHLGQKGV